MYVKRAYNCSKGGGGTSLLTANHWPSEIGWLLQFYALATSKVISGRIPICDSVHSWWLYNGVIRPPVP